MRWHGPPSPAPPEIDVFKEFLGVLTKGHGT